METKHGHKRKTSTPSLPHGENGPPNEKKSLLYGENGHSKGEKHVPTLIFFSSPEIEIPLASPPWLALGPIDNKINNIFRNYSSRNYIKIHSRMHPSALFHKKNSRESIPSNPLAMKLNSVIRTARQRNRDLLQYLHI